MNPIVSLDPKSLTDAVAESTTDEVLYGLSKQRFGFLIAAPDSGKGYLSLSIAYELATQVNILGLSGREMPLKTLIWPIEDGTGVLAKRILKQTTQFSETIQQAIEDNISIYHSDAPVMASEYQKTGSLNQEVTAQRNMLIDAAKGYDLLIIDTIREAMGTADVVKDDLIVKSMLKQIAKEADVAILCIHHFTKETLKGNDKMTSISGTGLSSTQANSRYAIMLETKKVKNVEETFLRHIKGNDIPLDQKIVSSAPLTWTDDSLLIRFTESYQELVVSQKLAKRRKIPSSTQPQEITIDESLLSEESKILAQQNTESYNILDDDSLVALRRHKAKNGQS